MSRGVIRLSYLALLLSSFPGKQPPHKQPAPLSTTALHLKNQIMKKIAFTLLLGIIVYGCAQLAKPNPTNTTTLGDNPADGDEADTAAFPDFGYMVPPSEYSGPVFQLSQNYPDTLPSTVPAFLSVDYKKDWRGWLEKAQDYCFEGNLDIDFRIEKNPLRKWYHMPWQHTGPNGREGFHGLTQEAPVQAYQLAATQSDGTTGAVAIGFYNDIAGYTIGKMWKKHDHPIHNQNYSFQQGAVLFKFLFVTFADSTKAARQVPSLTNGIWWDGYVVSDFTKMNTPNPAMYRHRSKVVLIQMDVMVRDTTSPHGWIFGNFQYNGNMHRPEKWKNLVPVGIMWDEDPTDTTNQSNPKPVKTVINTSLKGTIINPDASELPPTHLGWNGRLNGPVDNPMSSCYSCHSTAEYPQLALMSPLFNSDTLRNNPPGSPGWMRWFLNLPCGKPFDQDARSMDFSYQLAISLQNFYDWKLQQGGLFASAYANNPAAQPAQNKLLKGQALNKLAETRPRAMLTPEKTDRRVVPIQFTVQ
jgi:hypothetical protein